MLIYTPGKYEVECAVMQTYENEPGNITISVTDKTTMASLQTTVPKSRWVGLAGPLLQTARLASESTSTPLPSKIHTLEHVRTLSLPSLLQADAPSRLTQHPPPQTSNSSVRLWGDIPTTDSPITATPTYSAVCGEKEPQSPMTREQQIPIMLLRAPNRFLHHAVTSKKNANLTGTAYEG